MGIRRFRAATLAALLLTGLLVVPTGAAGVEVRVSTRTTAFRDDFTMNTSEYRTGAQFEVKNSSGQPVTVRSTWVEVSVLRSNGTTMTIVPREVSGGVMPATLNHGQGVRNDATVVWDGPIGFAAASLKLIVETDVQGTLEATKEIRVDRRLPSVRHQVAFDPVAELTAFDTATGMVSYLVNGSLNVENGSDQPLHIRSADLTMQITLGTSAPVEMLAVTGPGPGTVIGPKFRGALPITMRFKAHADAAQATVLCVIEFAEFGLVSQSSATVRFFSPPALEAGGSFPAAAYTVEDLGDEYRFTFDGTLTITNPNPFPVAVGQAVELLAVNLTPALPEFVIEATWNTTWPGNVTIMPGETITVPFTDATFVGPKSVREWEYVVAINLFNTSQVVEWEIVLGPEIAPTLPPG